MDLQSTQVIGNYDKANLSRSEKTELISNGYRSVLSICETLVNQAVGGQELFPIIHRAAGLLATLEALETGSSEGEEAAAEGRMLDHYLDQLTATVRELSEILSAASRNR